MLKDNGVSPDITKHLLNHGMFLRSGVYVMVDGQYGSTGKGLLASILAPAAFNRVHAVTTNQGPNSGHTSYYGDEKVVLKQLPTLPVALMKMYGYVTDIIMNPGAVINFEVLQNELTHYPRTDRIFLSQQAAVVSTDDLTEDKDTVRRIASTGTGMGPAIARKVSRFPEAVVKAHPNSLSNVHRLSQIRWPDDQIVFMEVAQGFSLGLHDSFYPNVTSRECTVMQGLADARIPAQFLRKVVMSLRTFPIRVGSTENSSGGCYPDQREVTFEEIGVEPEYTTVTKRKRRIFTWSNTQFMEALQANRPDVLFINFMNYLPEGTRETFLLNVLATYRITLNRSPDAIILGYGAKASDAVMWRPQ